MDLCSARLKQKGNFIILPLKELLNLNNVNLIKFSPCTRMVAFASERSVRIVQLKYGTKSCEEILFYHSDFVIEVC